MGKLEWSAEHQLPRQDGMARAPALVHTWFPLKTIEKYV